MGCVKRAPARCGCRATAARSRRLVGIAVREAALANGTVTGAVTVCASAIAGASTQANSVIVAVTRVALNFRRRTRRVSLVRSPTRSPAPSRRTTYWRDFNSRTPETGGDAGVRDYDDDDGRVARGDGSLNLRLR